MVPLTVVGASLLGAIKDVLGDAATDEIMGAWGDAYSFLADVLIAREKTIYEEHAAAPGGWTDWRDFTVENTRPESDIIRSFRLRPADGGPVMRHRPGQYLTFALELPEHGRLKRNYSISSGPEDTSYRITRGPSPERQARGGGFLTIPYTDRSISSLTVE